MRCQHRRDAALDVVQTDELRAYLAVIVPWLRRREPFILCGPLGCGKATLMRAALAALPGTAVAEMACNAQTLAKHVIEKLLQASGEVLGVRVGGSALGT